VEGERREAAVLCCAARSDAARYGVARLGAVRAVLPAGRDLAVARGVVLVADARVGHRVVMLAALTGALERAAKTVTEV
jgi:hypothetical protein